jgi:hypothetical protein
MKAVSMHAQGQLHWQCDLNVNMAQCCLLTPADTQQGWLLAAAVDDEVRGQTFAICCEHILVHYMRCSKRPH